MTQDFLKLNKKKLLNLYLWSSGVFAIGYTILLFFFLSDITIFEITFSYLVTIVVYPFIIVGFCILDWFLKHKYKKRIISQKPYSELKKIGFTKKMIKTNQNGLLYYSDFAEINDCIVIFDVYGEKPKVAEFSIYGTTLHLTNKEYTQKISEYNFRNIDFSHTSFSRNIDTKRESLNSIKELEKKLVELTHMAKKEKYKPTLIEEHKTSW